MLSYFSERKQRISRYLREVFERKQSGFGRINRWGPDLLTRLERFSLDGKMIRGGLVSLSWSLWNEEETTAAVQAGAALELIQSALLIHDDIMDRDETRRGGRSIFSQYAEVARKAGIDSAEHAGESMGICAGDVAFFVAFELLAEMDIEPRLARMILKACAQEIAYVGVAQMQDVFFGSQSGAVGESEILNLYLYKTGRYTFSLPLVVGGLLADRPVDAVRRLEKLGERLGVIFQIKDDELGLFGDQNELGKPVGSDVKEGKKTLFYGYLIQRASETQRERLSGIYGNKALGSADLDFVRDLTCRLGIRAQVNEVVDGLAARARELLAELEQTRSDAGRMLGELLEYSLARTR